MRVGIVGCGGMGNVHADMARNCGLKIQVCADRNLSRAERIASRCGAVTTDDCFGLTRRDDVDIVVVTTPTPEHVPLVIAAAEAGKDIFCEKPFGRTLSQCEEAIQAVKRAGVKLFVGHVVRYFQEFEAIKTAIDSGKVGKPGFVRTYRGGIFPRGEEGWFQDYTKSGGVTLDTIIHDFDWIRYVFGNPIHVFCQAIRRTDHIDYSLVTLRMESGVIAHVVGTWAHPAGFRVKAEVCGDKGMVSYDSNEAPISSIMRTQPGEVPGVIVPGSPVPVSPYQLEWEDFLAWRRGERTPRVSMDDAVWAVRIALGALESADTGEAVVF